MEENTLLDYAEDEEDYKDAKALLEDHEALVNELYRMATTAIYGEGFCIFNEATVTKELRDINFLRKRMVNGTVRKADHQRRILKKQSPRRGGQNPAKQNTKQREENTQ